MLFSKQVRFLRKARPPEGRASFASFGKRGKALASFRKQLRFPWSPKLLPAFRRKRTCFEKSTSFGFLNVLREASPLAASFGSTHVLREAGEGTPFPAFRRKRTCFEKSASFGFLRLPSASFGFLRLPSESFTSGGLLSRPSGSVGRASQMMVIYD